MEYKLNNKYSGFILNSKEHIEEINSDAYIFEHEKTKAKLLYLKNDDTNKVFSIGFKTPPEDSTGVMHILEHSVLCGSQKFPTKEPFVELVKGSLNTFLNAMTYTDKTIYPIASQNHKDFFNLMEVYLDAVFYPNIYKTKEILMQEGWHYELENIEDELTYKGVVYNEMKGAFSSPEGILMRKIQETLFPDTCYSNESGGDPKYIPDLTYEQFIDTHKKYYHPSNSYIYLYGDCDVQKAMEFISEEYLNKFEQKEIDAKIELQKPYEDMKEFTYSYSISEEDDDKEKTFLALNYVTGKSTDDDVYMDLSLLEFILLGAEGAPLKKAIIDSEIGKDVFGSFDGGIKQPVFSVIAKNSDPQKANEFKSVVENTLKELVKNGIDKKLIEGCINAYEFRLREADTGGYPKGLIYYMNAMDSWLYDGDPLMHIKYENQIQNIKKALTTNYFESLIEKYLLNNSHSSLLILKPEKGLSDKEEKQLQEELNTYKSSLREDEIQKIVDETEGLIVRQSTPDSPELLETIPLLSLEDIEKNVEELEIDSENYNDIKILKHNSFTSNIAYLNFLFDAKCIKEDDIQYFSLLGNLLGKVDTKNYNYKELFNEILINTGDLYFRNQIYGNEKDYSSYNPYMEIHSKVMDDKLYKSLELMAEIIQNSLFTDNKRIREIIRELISRLEMILMQAGHQVAVGRVGSYFSPSALYMEKTSGYDYFKFLKDLENNFDEKIEDLKAKLVQLQKTVFNKNNLTIFITGEEKELNELKKNLNIVLNVLSDNKVEECEYKFEETPKNEGLMTPGNVQYVAKGYNFKKLGYEYKGSMLVLKTILGYDYLWNRVRVKGGAYGAMTTIARTGNMAFVSYRDPNLEQTLEAYNEAPKFIEEFDVSDREMTKYIIGTISNLEGPLTPSARGEKALGMYMRGITKEDRQKERNEVLSSTVADIKTYSKVINDVMKQDFIAVVGNEKKIKENSNLFKDTINVFN